MALTANINSNTSGFDKGIAKVRRDIKSLDNIGSRISLGSFTGTLGANIASSVVSGITAGIATIGRIGLDFTTQSISKAMDLETATMQFEVFLKSAEAAADLVTDIKRTAATTPFEFPELADASKALISAEVSQNDVISTLRMLGDIASGTGADLAELAKIYGQVKTKGILQTERFNQFLDRSINLTKALAQVTGVTEEEIGDLMSSGQISFADFNKAMQSLVTSGGMFESMMIKLSTTTEGKLSSMRDAFSDMQKAFGTPLLPSIKTASDELSKTFAKFTPELEAIGSRLGAVFVNLAKDSSDMNKFGEKLTDLVAEAVFKGLTIGLKSLGKTALRFWDKRVAGVQSFQLEQRRAFDSERAFKLMTQAEQTTNKAEQQKLIAEAQKILSSKYTEFKPSDSALGRGTQRSVYGMIYDDEVRALKDAQELADRFKNGAPKAFKLQDRGVMLPEEASIRKQEIDQYARRLAKGDLGVFKNLALTEVGPNWAIKLAADLNEARRIPFDRKTGRQELPITNILGKPGYKLDERAFNVANEISTLLPPDKSAGQVDKSPELLEDIREILQKTYTQKRNSTFQ